MRLGSIRCLAIGLSACLCSPCFGQQPRGGSTRVPASTQDTLCAFVANKMPTPEGVRFGYPYRGIIWDLAGARLDEPREEQLRKVRQLWERQLQFVRCSSPARTGDLPGGENVKGLSRQPSFEAPWGSQVTVVVAK